MGARVGSAFSAPLVSGTVHGSLSFLPYSFLDLGVDAGFLTAPSVRAATPGLEGFYSFFPFAHYNAGWISKDFALYGGIGGGLLFASYNYDDGDTRSVNVFAFDTLAGLWFRGFDLTITARTNFSGLNLIVAAGYSWRF